MAVGGPETRQVRVAASFARQVTRWWGAHDVRNAGTGRKTLRHPTNGPTKYEYASFQANDDPTLRLVPHTPV